MKRPTPRDLVKQRALDARIAAARKGNPSWDARGIYTEKLRELADLHGLDVVDVVDEWSERAAARQYDAGVTIDEAERLAFSDIVDAFTRQRKMAV